MLDKFAVRFLPLLFNSLGYEFNLNHQIEMITDLQVQSCSALCDHHKGFAYQLLCTAVCTKKG